MAANDASNADDTPPPTVPVPVIHVTLLVIYLLTVALFTAKGAYCVWPIPVPEKPAPEILAWHEARLVRFVFYFGVLGACLHAMSSLVAFTGLRKFLKSWTVWYLLRPVIGGLLAWIVYLLFRGGLLQTSAVGSINPYTFGALAAIAGMFSDPVMRKIGGLVDNLLKLPTAGSAAGQGPQIAALAPDTVSEASATTALTITGSGFAAGAVVEMGARTLTPKSIAATKIEVDVPKEVVAGQKSIDVRVKLAQPSGGAVSNVMKLKVTP